MLTPVWSSRFKRDVKRAQKRGKDMDKLQLARTGTHSDLFDE